MHEKNKYPVILICNSDIVVLGIVRSLGVKNVPVIVVNWKKSLACYSKFVTKNLFFPDPIKSEKEFISSLLSCGKDMRTQYGRRLLLLPTDDSGLLLTSDYYERLKEYFVILGDPTEKEGLNKFIRKDLFFEKVREANIPMPVTIPCLNNNEVDYVVKNMPYPCIVKPAIKDHSFSFFNYYHAKVIECDSPDSLHLTLQDVLDRGYEVIVQEKIPGDIKEYSLDMYSDRNGKVIAALVAHELREHPPVYGTATMMIVRWNQEAFEYGNLLLKGLKFWGISQIEFKKDSRDGKLKVIEMNIRPWLSIYITTGARINIPYIAYRDIYEQMNRETPLTPSQDVEGIIWIDLLRNLSAVLKNGRQVNNKTGLALSHNEKVYAIFSVSDPLPGIIHIMSFVKNILRGFIRNPAKSFTIIKSPLKILKGL